MKKNTKTCITFEVLGDKTMAVDTGQYLIEEQVLSPLAIY